MAHFGCGLISDHPGGLILGVIFSIFFVNRQNLGLEADIRRLLGNTKTTENLLGNMGVFSARPKMA